MSYEEPRLEDLDKEELVEQLRMAKKTVRQLGSFILYAIVALYVWAFKDEIVSLLVKLGAEVS